MYKLSELKSLQNIKFILTTAKKIPIKCNNNSITYGWYNIENIENRNNNKYKGKKDSMKYLHNIINNEINIYNIKSNRIIIGGFSQGASISIYSGLLYNKKLAGIICLSGYLLDSNLGKLINKDSKNTELFIYHGKYDNIVKIEYGKYCYDYLIKNGCNGKFYYGDFNGHTIDNYEMLMVQKFIINKFST